MNSQKFLFHATTKPLWSLLQVSDVLDLELASALAGGTEPNSRGAATKLVHGPAFALCASLTTGGTTGIGLATAKLFVAEGARLIVTGRNQETLAQAREILGPAVDVIAADAADLQQITNLKVSIAVHLQSHAAIIGDVLNGPQLPVRNL